MTIPNTTSSTTYDFAVEAVFHMADGSFFFVGHANRNVEFLSPASAEIIINGAVAGTIHIDTERMPGPPPKRLQTLVSTGAFDREKFGENFILRCTPEKGVAG